jgi:copper chaperone CopZ
MAKPGETILKLDGLSCEHCQKAVENALQEVAGVTAVRVELARQEVRVAGSATVPELSKAVEAAGYTLLAYQRL